MIKGLKCMRCFPINQWFPTGPSRNRVPRNSWTSLTVEVTMSPVSLLTDSNHSWEGSETFGDRS